ncbi:MAG: O-antigen ligase family protein [Planctomycetes bacterium]|nr:O-antigen ligase family protein [Planctomycetota bacterium]
MSTVERYLQIIPLPVLMIAPVGALLAFLLIPGRYRMLAALSLTVAWLPLSEYEGLGIIQALAKTTGFAVYMLLAVTAWMNPGPRRRLPLMAWLYPAVALLGFLYIWTVTDRPLAFVISVQWLTLVIAALAVSQTIVDRASLLRVGGAITVGLAIALALPLSDLVLHPGTAFGARGRFSPYGMNANHVGVVFGLAAPLALYAAIRARPIIWKALLVGVAVAAVGMGVLTASRSTVWFMAGSALPLALAMTGRPMMTLSGAIILAVGVNWALGEAGEVPLERLSTVETRRVEIAEDFLGVIAQRPWFGLLGTEGESFRRAETEFIASRNPHNAYLHILYFGGISYALPVFTLAAFTGWCAFRTWKGRRLVAADPLLINMLVAIMVMTYAHGFVNQSMYYPTSPLAFPHVLLSAIFMGLAMDLKRRGEALVPQAPDDAASLYLDYGDESPDDDSAQRAA